MLEENMSAVNYFTKQYGKDQVDLIEKTIHHLIQKLHPSLNVRIAWAVLRRAPMTMLSLRCIQLCLIGDGQQRQRVPFILNIRKF